MIIHGCFHMTMSSKKGGARAGQQRMMKKLVEQVYKHSIKMLKDVGMTVAKTIETRVL